MNIPKQALVVVGDGEKALFLRNVGTVRKLELEVENVLAHGNPSTHEQGTDKPGRTSAAWALRAARWKRAIRISWAKSGSPARSQPYFIGLPTPKSFSWNESHRLQARSPPVGYCDTPGRRRPPFRRRSRYVATDAIRVRPIRFDGDCRKLLLLDQPLRDLCALLLEIVSSVRGRAQQHEASVADPFQQRIVVRDGGVVSSGANDLYERVPHMFRRVRATRGLCIADGSISP